ncbi:MAG: serine/threonine-protein kinase [Candidatus Eisenbacteria bacterium]|uniref:Serine/threonine-protein kinase n=1 Tax=Eiseniibacteriota bacterium TaxID=2212470 RepID=A0A948RY43_UNCEI|nr:serine/threonine-protein kinase [Candidatus Eisenbacteria bacterium]MBU1948113.1 serine/threonine-protein kinase [Candidatus Eisenbacteria bacterium]MBU2692586.1 serine/threonine-protein kinase [Candidatus Eisenbacteria bacterium]
MPIERPPQNPEDDPKINPSNPEHPERDPSLSEFPESESLFIGSAQPPSGSTPSGISPSDGANGVIAGYRIIRRIGAGGMGVVYEAEQQNPRRRVALKVIRGGAVVDEHHVKLFQREAQALALLKHPNIAAIHDAGQTENGQHYFAMELITGVPLDAYLQSRPLGDSPTRHQIRERLALFLQICRAIAYAHQRSVIHRDLKPSNIFVIPPDGEDAGASRRDAQVKILDFGLARLTDADVSLTTMVSEVGKIRGTLAYMSPEQARGNPDAIDLRSDVYSLGVILYEMLTGQRPYDVHKAMIHEAIRVICEEDPAKPSGSFKLLRGDLETITLKALEKNPADRYQSVSALVDDIERHLANQPILASPPSAVYQFRKLVSRHRGPFAFAATLFILSIVFGITMSVLFGQQRVLRARAEAEAQKADQINTFLRDMLGSVNPSGMGKDVTVREVLDEAAKTIDEGLADQPEVRAAVQSTIGDTYFALGFIEEAAPHLEGAYAVQREILGETHPDVAMSLFRLARLRMAQSKEDSAEVLARQVLEIERAHYGEEHPTIATHLCFLASVLDGRGKYEEAEQLYLEALAMQEKLLGKEHLDMVPLLESYAIFLGGQGHPSQAEKRMRAALEIQRKHHGDNHPSLATNLINLAYFLSSQEKYEEAEATAREAIDLWREHMGEEHESYPALLNILGSILSGQNKRDEAESVFRQALDRRIQLYGEEGHVSIAASLNNLALFLFKAGKYQDSEDMYKRAEVIWREHFGDEHLHIASLMGNLSLVLKAEGKLQEGEAALAEAVRLNEILLGNDAINTIFTRMEHAVYAIDRGEGDGCESMLRDIADSLRAKLPEKSWIPYLADNILASCLAAQRRHEEADSLFTRSRQPILDSTIAAARKADALDRMVRHYTAWEKPEEAARYQAEIDSLMN